MGGKFSQLAYNADDTAVLEPFMVLATCWNHHHIRGLSARLKRISFNFCVTRAKFGELVQLDKNEFFQGLCGTWYELLRNSPTSSIVNGLEFLAALALTTKMGTFNDKILCVFDIFDFDETQQITKDELQILIKSCIRGLSKVTRGLGVRMATLCPLGQITQLTEDCFRECDTDGSGEVSRQEFSIWCRASPKVYHLVKHFCEAEPLDETRAAVIIQVRSDVAWHHHPGAFLRSLVWSSRGCVPLRASSPLAPKARSKACTPSLPPVATAADTPATLTAERTPPPAPAHAAHPLPQAIFRGRQAKQEKGNREHILRKLDSEEMDNAAGRIQVKPDRGQA
jgi:Ca2+-binding EF-hand superfamily protein